MTEPNSLPDPKPRSDGWPAPRSALADPNRFTQEIGNRRLALFLDYDGTLTPIVRRPEEALLPPETRDLLQRLAARCAVGIVSGRDRADVERMVGLDELIFAGSHGFDIRGPSLRMEHPQAQLALPELDAAERQLQQCVQSIPGARVERKKFAVAIHYREVADDRSIAELKAAVESFQRDHPSLRMMAGKMIFELQPDIPWNKGRAVRWLCDALKLHPSKDAILYVGDDVTDEDAFRVLADEALGLGIRVTQDSSGTCASYSVRDTDEMKRFLEFLLNVAT